MHSAAEGLVVADFPRPVTVALRRAQEIADACGLPRVVVAIADEQEWNPAWGDLVQGVTPEHDFDAEGTDQDAAWGRAVH